MREKLPSLKGLFPLLRHFYHFLISRMKQDGRSLNYTEVGITVGTYSYIEMLFSLYCVLSFCRTRSERFAQRSTIGKSFSHF